ncbi:helix-turn-helix domain-containing protein [Salmonella bongori]|uniref:Helix-turn-helix domain-containing protein n=5 Tax=Salmonella enterica I TaxID=59201 RepID=A0A5W2LZ22_SALET|nr:helix-turn-helix domain-containing protein [Salmonella bongori]EAA1722545.1 hypothetical protein [Salmonella enterica subsp. enterica serovar Oranienburg]EAA3838900.1 hypothetical protein [Salmonella enterica subsp. houtenae]EAA4000685.1 hypothetical protein [Salmonella enterica subsp. enterica serovar Ealing]EAA5554736.1 hypothetical protein [Salmonella enterica subsp. enterica serovar Cotham]EAA7336947.1 helix-turn-helix domain-containing protein [Salmonella enterica subsp. enterica]EAB1
MFNVKRNGASVEITDIPQSVPFSVFKNIADETGANECLFAYVKDKNTYEVVIHHDSVNMAGAVAWLALEAREPATRDVDISTIGKRIGVIRAKQHMNAQELEEVIGAPEGSVFRWETGKTIPSSQHINELAIVLKCDPQWLLYGKETKSTTSQENSVTGKIDQETVIKTFVDLTDAIGMALGISMKMKGAQFDPLDYGRITPSQIPEELLIRCS